MTLLSIICVKIFCTIVLWSLPLLISPVFFFELLGFPNPEPFIFFRLLGMAYTALVVGYILGALKLKKKEEYPSDTVWVGIVSNGGATAVLSVGALQGAWSQWGTSAKAYMWVSLACVALITIGLILSGPLGQSQRTANTRTE